MKKFIGGSIILLLGVFSFSVFFTSFLNLIVAVVPVTLILGGCLTIYLNRDSFSRSSDEDEPVVEEPVVEEPVVEEPVVEEPVVEEPAATSKLVGNTDSKVFHTQECKFAQSKKCTDFFDKREDAVQAGYKPCGRCKP